MMLATSMTMIGPQIVGRPSERNDGSGGAPSPDLVRRHCALTAIPARNDHRGSRHRHRGISRAAYDGVPRPPPSWRDDRDRPPSRRSGGEHHRRDRSEEHTSELQSLMRISYSVFFLK